MKKNTWVEVPEGTVGCTKNGTTFEMGETEIFKVHEIFEGEVVVHGGAFAFKAHDVHMIKPADFAWMR